MNPHALLLEETEDHQYKGSMYLGNTTQDATVRIDPASQGDRYTLTLATSEGTVQRELTEQELRNLMLAIDGYIDCVRRNRRG